MQREWHLLPADFRLLRLESPTPGMNGEMNGIPSALQVCVISGRRPGEKKSIVVKFGGKSIGFDGLYLIFI